MRSQGKVFGFALCWFYDRIRQSMFVCWGKWASTEERERLCRERDEIYSTRGGAGSERRRDWPLQWLQASRRGFQTVRMNQFGPLAVKDGEVFPSDFWLLKAAGGGAAHQWKKKNVETARRWEKAWSSILRKWEMQPVGETVGLLSCAECLVEM